MKQLPSKIVLALAFMCSCSYRKATLHKQSTLERREDSFNELPLERSSFHILKLHLKTLDVYKVQPHHVRVTLKDDVIHLSALDSV